MAKDWNTQLETFAAGLEKALGPDLVSLVLYGSAARDHFRPDRSDLNLLLILRDASPGRLRPIGPLVHAWVKAGQPPPLIFSHEGWRASTDVFPLEMEDMRQAHRLVRGEDPFAGLETSRADQRQELEREALGKLLQLRAEYVASGPHPKALGALLVHSAGTFLALFRAVLRMRGAVPPAAPQELVKATAQVVGFDPAAFDWVLEARAGRKVRSLEQFDAIAERYLAAVERLKQFVDAM